MPTHMRGYFSSAQLKTAELHPGFSFTKDLPVLRTAGWTFSNPHVFGTLLFDLETDPRQAHPVVDDALELTMATALTELLRRTDAPPSQYERLGLPEHGAVTQAHLLCRTQREQALAAREPAPSAEDFVLSPWSVHTSVAELLAHEPAAEILKKHCRPARVAPFGDVCGDMSLYRAAQSMVGVLPWATMRTIADELATLA
jgi:hypothetical protein